MTTPQAFDSLASDYDNLFTNSQIGHYLRRRVHARLDRHFFAGDHVLELGCGTGEDALYLAKRGVRVTATDASAAMLAVARNKAGDHPLITLAHLDLRNLPEGTTRQRTPTNNRFGGAFSNFGAVNVLSDWRKLSKWLAGKIKPGGIVGLGVMSPLCLWELLWHGTHLDFRTATRRWRKNAIFQPDSNIEATHITYPTIRRLTRDFTPWFRRIHVRPLGLFLPPSDVYAVVEKRLHWLRVLTTFERRFEHMTQLALFADHYWIEFERLDQ